MAHDAGIAERTALIEFDSSEQAVAAHESTAYQEAWVALSDSVERDFRIVEGIDCPGSGRIFTEGLCRESRGRAVDDRDVASGS